MRTFPFCLDIIILWKNNLIENNERTFYVCIKKRGILTMRRKYQEVIEVEECKQAVMLARVSSKKQERGASLEAQVEKIEEYAYKNGFKIIEPSYKAFVFTESSSRGGRKKFNEMIEFIEKQDHKTAILVHTLDRLQRGFSECEKIQQLLKAGKIEVHFINEFLVLDKFSTDDEFARYDFGILAAKMYLTALNKNVKRSQKHNREAGIPQRKRHLKVNLIQLYAFQAMEFPQTKTLHQRKNKDDLKTYTQGLRQ